MGIRNSRNSQKPLNARVQLGTLPLIVCRSYRGDHLANRGSFLHSSLPSGSPHSSCPYWITRSLHGRPGPTPTPQHDQDCWLRSIRQPHPGRPPHFHMSAQHDQVVYRSTDPRRSHAAGNEVRKDTTGKERKPERRAWEYDHSLRV
jgi:hypothetical protein